MEKDNRTYERLFCCECGREVKPGATARVVPALQPGTGGTGGSPRPHVWCQACLGEEQTEAKARPKPHELSGTATYDLHQYIWAVGEGRTDKALVKTFGTNVWGEKLSTLLRELTEAGKIERRGDRRVALCAPWQEPKAEPYTEAEADSIYAEPLGDAPCADCSPSQATARQREASAAKAQCSKCGGIGMIGVSGCNHMTRCLACDGERPELQPQPFMPFGPYEDDPVEKYADDEARAFDPEALQADRYPVDPNDDRLMMIEKLLRKLLERIDHLVCMDNEKG